MTDQLTYNGEVSPLTPNPALDRGLFARFVSYTDRTDLTTRNYINCLRIFATWLDDHCITAPGRNDIIAYRDYLQGECFGRSGNGQLKSTTQAQYLQAVKHFFKWTAAEGIYPNVAENVHGPKIRQDIHRKDPLGRDDVAKIAASIDRATVSGKRLYIMYMMTITCGLRDVELARANIGDVKTGPDKRVYLFVRGKGHFEADTPVHLIPPVSAALDDYIRARTDADDLRADSPLFVSSSNRSLGQRILPGTISAMLKSLLVAAGYDSERLTAHSLRHTSNNGVYQATHDIYQVQLHARHRSPITTQIYIHADDRSERNTEQLVYDYYFADHCQGGSDDGNQDNDSDYLRETIDLLRALSPDKLRIVRGLIDSWQ